MAANNSAARSRLKQVKEGRIINRKRKRSITKCCKPTS